MRGIGIIVVVAVWLGSATAAWAFTCPVVIKQADDLIKRAEAGKAGPETKALLDEARKELAEAKAHHETAKTKKDHGDAVRKARIAAAYAEEAIALQNP